MVAGVAAGAASATEIGATRLVFEKSAKMKKIETALYLSFVEEEVRQLSCGVIARGKSGAIPVAGSLRLRLDGDSENGREVWKSSAVERAVDDHGDAIFEVGDLTELVAEALIAEARVRLVRVDFQGGRGGRASELTLDCLYERVGP